MFMFLIMDTYLPTTHISKWSDIYAYTKIEKRHYNTPSAHIFYQNSYLPQLIENFQYSGRHVCLFALPAPISMFVLIGTHTYLVQYKFAFMASNRLLWYISAFHNIYFVFAGTKFTFHYIHSHSITCTPFMAQICLSRYNLPSIAQYSPCTAHISLSSQEFTFSTYSSFKA